jgi:hypothetical protein
MKRDSGFLIFHFGMNVTFGMQAPKNCSKNMNSAVLAGRRSIRKNQYPIGTQGKIPSGNGNIRISLGYLQTVAGFTP